jgi:hypothetical protein
MPKKTLSDQNKRKIKEILRQEHLSRNKHQERTINALRALKFFDIKYLWYYILIFNNFYLSFILY